MENTLIDKSNLDACVKWLEGKIGNTSETQEILHHAKKLVEKDPGKLTGEEVHNLAIRQMARDKKRRFWQDLTH